MNDLEPTRLLRRSSYVLVVKITHLRVKITTTSQQSRLVKYSKDKKAYENQKFRTIFE